MKPAGQLQRRGSLKRGSGPRRSVKRESLEERAARDAFNDIVLQGFMDEPNPCLFSVTRSDHECAGVMDAHHLIEKQFLRDRFCDLPEDELLAIVYDPRIGVPLCRAGAHDPVTRHSDYVYLDELPLEATDFAADHQIVFRLERECPARKRSS